MGFMFTNHAAPQPRTRPKTRRGSIRDVAASVRDTRRDQGRSKTPVLSELVSDSGAAL